MTLFSRFYDTAWQVIILMFLYVLNFHLCIHTGHHFPGISKSPGTASLARCGSGPPKAVLSEAGRAFVCTCCLRERPVCFGLMG